MTTQSPSIRFLQISLPLVILVAAGLSAYAIIINKPLAKIETPKVELPGVRVETVVLETVQLSVESEGTVRPRTESQLVPEIAGRVNWVSSSFVNGGFFEVGDVLVKIDRFNYQQAVIVAEAQLVQARLKLALEEAESDVARREWTELGRGDPRSLTLREPQLKDALAAVAASEALLERALRDLERTEITAPYAGRVKSKGVDVGQFVTVGTPIATIYAVDVAEVRLPLPDEQLAYLDLPLSYRDGLRGGGPRVVLSAHFAGEIHEWHGRIARTEGEIDPVTRMIHVVAEVQDPYASGSDPVRPPLAVGMYVQAEIEGKTFDNIAVLPREALRGNNQLLVIADNQIYFKNVELLRATADAIYVRGGLVQGELVAVSPINTPTDGMHIQIIAHGETTAAPNQSVTDER